ncbi:uncharacterized protein UV8b_05558 [Ustilaginoidea virens]|uniref:Uncharacterized protein n=1 Tax=Ustilaginoidea virens TaxID=1159556 RepID=A0A1B5L1R0_USTVR|nr:uncharacterized protein UV8b_05558 [Ustilaginoidea virens]QUC21315.1 hypothetical protein UV8b_05558 [Ustilaginoidea virens]GAO17328.1 hypothetical protein UVI_02044850 [Ustilaginoidea virens]
MLTNALVSLCLAALSATGASAAVAYCPRESTELNCYGGPLARSGPIDPKDLASIADYLRDYSKQVKGGRLYSMTSRDAPCGAEWTVYSQGTASLLARHVDPTKNSIYAYEDIADTVDGGLAATGMHSDTLMYCMHGGGSVGIHVNQKNPIYWSDEYRATGGTPEGILLKVIPNV